MKCEIIKDLIPLCSEGLCSEESENEIKEHIKNCENCRLLYSNIPKPETTHLKLPDENQTFSKVNKKMKRSRLKIILLSLLLVIIVSIVGYLSACQIGKFPETHSFETIAQSIEVRKIANYIVNGEMDKYVDSISDGFVDDIYNFKYIEEYKQADTERLHQVYDKYMKNNSAKITKIDSCYAQMYANDSHCILNNVTITLKKTGEEVVLTFTKNVDGKYILVHSGILTSENPDIWTVELNNTLNYANYHQDLPINLLPILIVKPNVVKESTADSVAGFASRRFITEYAETVKANMIDFYEQGFIIENATWSTPIFDSESNYFYHQVSLTATNGTGSAVINIKLYTTPQGLISPSKKDKKIYSENCSEELTQSLSNFFG